MKHSMIIIHLLIIIVLTGCLSVSVKDRAKEDDNGFVKKIEIESLKFYTADEKGEEKAFRVYNDEFRKNAVDHIWYELIVINLMSAGSKMQLKEVWTGKNSEIISSTIKEMTLAPDERYLEYCAGIKTEWEPGYYELNLYQDSLKLVGKEFKIIN